MYHLGEALDLQVLPRLRRAPFRDQLLALVAHSCDIGPLPLTTSFGPPAHLLLVELSEMAMARVMYLWNLEIRNPILGRRLFICAKLAPTES